jgi:exodeoxyribonuclease VII large subunit
MSEKQIFTLKQVVSSIKKTIDDRYKMAYWVKAEMHKLNRYPSGHCFPELVQKEDGKIVAQLSGTIWKTVMNRVNKSFMDLLKEPLKEGSNLLLLVKVTFNETYGLSLQILDIDPSFVLGELQREREETLKRLTKEGILNNNQNIKFPLLPKRIAIISADTSKGLSDFMNVLKGNEYGYRFYTHLFPAALQGDIAPESIQRQLRIIEKVKDYFDVVVIVRGGGGEVSMTCYNNFELCKAIVNFPLPVLTGIGHSTNLTVAEMIAYRNGITPTELAEMLIRSFHDFAVPLENAQKTVIRTAENVLNNAEKSLAYTQKLFLTMVTSEFSRQKVSLKEVEKDLVKSFRDWNEVKATQITRESERMVREAQFLVRSHQQKLISFTEKLKPSSERTLRAQTEKIDRLAHNIELLSPKMVLKRGYSITRVNGKVISKENQAKKGDKILTFTHDFELESEITELKNTQNE